MEDADSGIYQSRTDSIVDDKEAIYLSSATTTIAGSGTQDSSSSTSNVDDLSDVSSIEIDDITSSSYSSSEEEGSAITPPAIFVPQVPKKRLSLSDSFLASSVERDVSYKPELLPGMKVTNEECEKIEKWKFINSRPYSKDAAILPEKQGKDSQSNPKRILKLHLSTSSLETPSESDHTPSPKVSIFKEVARASSSAYVSPTSDDADFSEAEQESRMAIYIELRDTDKSQCSEWRRVFNSDENVTVLCRDFFLSEFDHDAVIVPGNSFGYLDGEPEIKFTEKFGWQIQRKVQDYICNISDGEMLVGEAVVIRLAQDDFGNETGVKFAIYVPTMRVPLHVGDSVNAYLAFRAAMRAVRTHNRKCHTDDLIMTLLCPSLCNSFGGMPPGRIAHQMKEAYDAIILQSGKLSAVNGLGSLATHHVDMTTKSSSRC